MIPQHVLGELYVFEPNENYIQGVTQVGTFNRKLRGASKTDHSIYWTKAISLDESLKLFDWPNRGAEAEYKSLLLQANKRKSYEPPESDVLENSISFLVNKYKKFSLNYNDFNYETIEKQIVNLIAQDGIKMDASPGVPYSSVYTTNKQFINSSLHLITHLVWSRIQLRLQNPDVNEPTKLIELGLCDPVKIFVKEEPHKIKKIMEGRVRIIMSVSIIDKIIELILIKPLKSLEINSWTEIPSKPGMGFTDEMVKIIYDKVSQMNRPVSTDVEGWDWSVMQWMLDADAEIMIRLCHNPFKQWIDLVKITAKLEGNSIYCLSDSRMFTLQVKGNQNSGKLKTSMSNSRMRALIATLAGSKDCICMGDDDIEEFTDNAVENYAKTGIKIKIYDEVKGDFEFCSKIFTNNGCYPVSYGKTLMKLLHQKPKTWEEYVGYMVGFEDEMKNHPEYQRIKQLISDTGFVQTGGEQMTFEENEFQQ